MSTDLAVVTGATGWLGRRLVEVLTGGLADLPRLAMAARDRPIRALVARGADTTGLRDGPGRVAIFEGDLREPSSLDALLQGARGATLFHCAGLIHPACRVRQLDEVNVSGTQNLVDAARRAGVRRLIHVSSNSPFGCNPTPDGLLDESSPYNPTLNYGRTKMLAERIVTEAGASGGLQTVILRPPWFYGPHQPSRQTLFFRMIRTGRVPVVGSGQNLRSMGYVDNVCQGLLLAETVAQASGRAYWIADRRPYSMNEIVDTIERVMERDLGLEVAHRRIRLPSVVSEVAFLLDRCLQGLGLYNARIHVLSEMNKTIACSIATAQRELGYEPRVELEEGMRRSLLWVRERGIPL